jgi:hypothetical protein
LLLLLRLWACGTLSTSDAAASHQRDIESATCAYRQRAAGGQPWDFVVKFEVVGLAFRQLEPGDVCLRKLHGVGPGALASGNWEAYGKHARDYP